MKITDEAAEAAEAAFRDYYDPAWNITVTQGMRAALEAALPHMEGWQYAEAKVKDYEHRIGWDTSCGECAALLDRLYENQGRAERAEAVLAAVEGGIVHALEEHRRLSEDLLPGHGGPWVMEIGHAIAMVRTGFVAARAAIAQAGTEDA